MTSEPNSPQTQQELPEVPKLTLQRFVRVLKRYLPFLYPYWPQLLLLFLIVPLSVSVVATIPALCSKLVIDIAFPRKDSSLLILLICLGFGALIMERTMGVIVRNTISGYLRIRILGALGSRFYHNMLRLNMKYHHRTPVGEKIFRSDTDIIDTAEMIGSALPFMIQYSFRFLMVITVMCLIDWRPVVIAAGCSPVFFIIAQYLYNHYRRVDLSQRLAGEVVTARLEQTLAAPAVVYSHGTRNRERLRYFRSLVRYSLANMVYWFMHSVSIVFVWPSGMPAITATFIIGLCGYYVTTEELSLGEWIALEQYIIQAIVPLGIIISYFQSLRLRMVPAERILSLLDTEERITEASDAKQLVPLKGRIEFRDVHFAYSPDKPVLQGASFVIEPGSRVAFVGASGIGKSTILNLILRFYDPDQGQILIDGVDLKQIKLDSYRKQIGIVLQEPVLFDGTIAHNVLYGAHDATDADLKRAASVAQLDEFVQDLPEGYDTLLSGAGDLSLGQRQRISVARSVAGNPKIVLLDEPTSLVDPSSTQTIIESIDRAAQDRTTVFVSHDLLSLKNLDEMIVLDQGVVKERGSHEQLLERKGLYFKLWNMQVNRRLDAAG